jgi:hypothetical protein
VEVIVSPSAVLNEEQGLSKFWKSFATANFEYTERTQVSNLAELDSESDPRLFKHHKTLSSFNIIAETGNVAPKKEGTLANAVNYARELANLRGSHADCDFMEE